MNVFKKEIGEEKEKERNFFLQLALWFLILSTVYSRSIYIYNIHKKNLYEEINNIDKIILNRL